MRRTHRSFGLKYKSNAAQINSKNQKCTAKRTSSLRSILPTSNDDVDTYLEYYFESMLPYVWYKILRYSPSDVYTITFTMGQIWLTYRLLLRLEYIFKYKDEVRLRPDKFSNLNHNKVRHFKLHLGSARPKNQKLILLIYLKFKI